MNLKKYARIATILTGIFLYDSTPVNIEGAIIPKPSKLEILIKENKNSTKKTELCEWNIKTQRLLETKKEPKYFSKEEIATCVAYTCKGRRLPKPISPKYICAKALVESGGNIFAESEDGARGLMQITEPTWLELSEKPFSKANDPLENLKVAVDYLIKLNEFCEENYLGWRDLSTRVKQELISAAYNGGPSRLKYRKWEIERMPDETRNYVKKMGKTMAKL